MKTRKKVAVFGIKTHPAYGGADRVAEHIVNNLADEYEFFVYLVDTPHRMEGTGNKHFIYLPCFKGKHLRPFSFFFFCTLHMIFVKRYDLIHAHNLDVGLFTYILKKNYRRQIIGTFHGHPYAGDKWGRLGKWYLRLSERLFVKSCSRLSSVSPMKPAAGKSVSHIPNGMEQVDRLVFATYGNTSINYHESHISKGNYILFPAGRLIRSKGLHHLLKAYADGNLTDQLLIISDFSHDPVYSAAIEQEIKKLGRSNIIVIKRLLPKLDLFDVIMHAKMVILPSEAEAMSMMLMEVLACSRIVVCSDIESNIRILGAGYRYLFVNGNAGSLLAAIRTALCDICEQRLECYQHKQEEWLHRYNWQEIASAYSQLYKSVL